MYYRPSKHWEPARLTMSSDTNGSTTEAGSGDFSWELDEPFLFPALLMGAILVTFSVVHFAEANHFHLIPESGIVILVGLTIGGIMKLIGYHDNVETFNRGV